MDAVEVGAGGGSQPCYDHQETASDQLHTSHSEMEQNFSQLACSSAPKPKKRKKEDRNFDEEFLKHLDLKGDPFDRFGDEVAEDRKSVV